MRSSILALALVACSRKTPPPPPAPPPAVSVTAPAPVAPALRVASGADAYAWKIETKGLPAISADGRRAVVLVDLPDGGRGYPSSELVFLAIDTDTVEQRVKLFVPDDFAAEPAILSARTAARVAKAEAELAKTSWIALTAARSVWNAATMKHDPRPVAGVDVSLASGRLRATTATSTLLDRDVRSWQVAPYTILGGPPCRFEPSLELVAIDPARRVVVVITAQIEVGGGDRCEQPSVAHALRIS